MTASSLRCYACGHEYRYLGRTEHPGRCPECRSHCVSPAGEVTPLVEVNVAPVGDPPAVTVLAIDDRSRHFLYHFDSPDGSVELVALQVDGHIVRTENAGVVPLVPDAVLDRVARHTSASAEVLRERVSPS